MERTVKVSVKREDGTEQNWTHHSADAHDIARFITGIADDQPGTEFTFTLVSEGERFPQPQPPQAPQQ